MKRFFSWLLVFSFLLLLTVPAMAADNATGTTLRLDEINGTVTVKDASGNDKTARASMRLYSGYTITTGASSSAYISLDETKAVKLDSSGKVEIKKSGKKLEVSLTTGQLYFNVTEPLKADESLNIRTSTMVTGIRGSFGWVNLTQMGLMHGHVTLTCMNPETGETRVTEVYSGEKVSYEQSTEASSTDPTLMEIDFVKEEIVLEDVPATVVEEIAKDETLQAQLIEDDQVAIDVTELIESLDDKKEEEKKQEEDDQKEVEQNIVAQNSEIATEAQEYVVLPSSEPEPDPDPDPNPVGPTPTSDPTPVVTSITVTNVSELAAALSSYDVVYYTGGDAYDTPIETLTVGSGHTLYVGNGSDYSSVWVSKTFTNSGTIIIQNNSYIYLQSSATGRNNGTMTINGGLTNDGTFDNYGTITQNGSD